METRIRKEKIVQNEGEETTKQRRIECKEGKTKTEKERINKEREKKK